MLMPSPSESNSPSNPDLVKWLRLDLLLNEYNRETFYTRDRRGYSDQPFS
jgi:hypothetical protein